MRHVILIQSTRAASLFHFKSDSQSQSAATTLRFRIEGKLFALVGSAFLSKGETVTTTIEESLQEPIGKVPTKSKESGFA